MDWTEVEDLQKLMGYDPRGFLFWAAPRRRIQVGARVGSLGSGGYVRFGFNGRTFTVHRAVWAWHNGYWPVEQVDHINRVRHDNRIENLRLVTPAENSQNNKARGYYRNQDKWLAKITANGVFHYLGTHQTEDEARKAYLNAKARLHIK